MIGWNILFITDYLINVSAPGDSAWWASGTQGFKTSSPWAFQDFLLALPTEPRRPHIF